MTEMSRQTTLRTAADRPELLLVTGPSGAGRSTAINALEDIGFEVIDNLPLSLLPRLLDGPPLGHPLALGLDVRNRDFSTNALIETIDTLVRDEARRAQVLYLEATPEELLRRYSETRRRHPLSPAGSPEDGIAREGDLLAPIRARADRLIDTTGMTPHDLRAEMERLYSSGDGRAMNVTLQSFSYKRGMPQGLDLVFDCRFLRNPHWDEALRKEDGRNPAVWDYIAEDPRYRPFFEQVRDLLALTLPGHREEGRSHVSVGFGCTGGQHRSVTMAERMADALAEQGWQVSKRHRELERRGVQAPPGKR